MLGVSIMKVRNITCRGPMTGSPRYAGGVGGCGGLMTTASALLLL